MRFSLTPRQTDSTHLCDEALQVLRRYWGHSVFRRGQWEAIESAMEGRDVLGILPTGAGKSLCYQIPAILSERLTIVVSPLIALMEDQMRGLLRRGIPAASLAGKLSRRAVEETLRSARFGAYRVLYVSPERLSSGGFRTASRNLPVGLLAVDEAHCVSEWGHDFRPDYRLISSIYDVLNRPPVIALTATATSRTRSDIIRCLCLDSPRVIQEGFDRPNLIFSVFRTHAKRKILTEVLHAVPGSALVYAPTRLDVESWGDMLQRGGYRVETYHGSMDSDTRYRAQFNWQSGRARIMIATCAFGMGIDKPDVRSVTHVGLPMSIEAYYQEAGRAGRDGKRAYATLLYGPEDDGLCRRMLKRTRPTPVGIRRIAESFGRGRREYRASMRLARRASVLLRSMTDYARASTCRRRRLLAYFGEYSIRDCGRCDVCLGRHRRFEPSAVGEFVYRCVEGAVLNGESPFAGMQGLGLPRYRQEQIIRWMERNGHLSTVPGAGHEHPDGRNGVRH